MSVGDASGFIIAVGCVFRFLEELDVSAHAAPEVVLVALGLEDDAVLSKLTDACAGQVEQAAELRGVGLRHLGRGG